MDLQEIDQIFPTLTKRGILRASLNTMLYEYRAILNSLGNSVRYGYFQQNLLSTAITNAKKNGHNFRAAIDNPNAYLSKQELDKIGAQPMSGHWGPKIQRL